MAAVTKVRTHKYQAMRRPVSHSSLANPARLVTNQKMKPIHNSNPTTPCSSKYAAVFALHFDRPIHLRGQKIRNAGASSAESVAHRILDQHLPKGAVDAAGDPVLYALGIQFLISLPAFIVHRALDDGDNRQRPKPRA